MVDVLRKVMVGVWYRQKLRGTREASNGGRVRVRIIHGLNISHKEKTKYCVHAPRGSVGRS